MTSTTLDMPPIHETVGTVRTLAVHTAAVMVAEPQRVLTSQPEVFTGTETTEAVVALLESMGQSDRMLTVTVEWEHESKNGNVSKPKIVFLGA